MRDLRLVEITKNFTAKLPDWAIGALGGVIFIILVSATLLGVGFAIPYLQEFTTNLWFALTFGQAYFAAIFVFAATPLSIIGMYVFPFFPYAGVGAFLTTKNKRLKVILGFTLVIYGIYLAWYFSSVIYNYTHQ